MARPLRLHSGRYQAARHLRAGLSLLGPLAVGASLAVQLGCSSEAPRLFPEAEGRGGAANSGGAAGTGNGPTFIPGGNTSSTSSATNSAGSGNSGVGGSDAAGGRNNEGGSAAGGASLGGSSSVGTEPQQVTLPIASDEDDCVWITGNHERLAYSSTEPHIEVSADEEQARAGLRFALPIPPGAVIESAVLRLWRLSGSAHPSQTIQVQIYDSSQVPPFSTTHAHGAVDHSEGGLYTELIGDMPVGEIGAATESPDLSVLLQHVIDRADWTAQGTVGLVLSPQTMTASWVGYADYAAEPSPAELSITFRASR